MSSDAGTEPDALHSTIEEIVQNSLRKQLQSKKRPPPSSEADLDGATAESAKATGRKRNRGSDVECHTCGGRGHMSYVCPSGIHPRQVSSPALALVSAPPPPQACLKQGSAAPPPGCPPANVAVPVAPVAPQVPGAVEHLLQLQQMQMQMMLHMQMQMQNPGPGPSPYSAGFLGPGLAMAGLHALAGQGGLSRGHLAMGLEPSSAVQLQGQMPWNNQGSPLSVGSLWWQSPPLRLM